MVQINHTFLKSFSTNEQLIMLQLLLHADINRVVEFDIGRISSLTGLSNRTVCAIRRKLLKKQIIGIFECGEASYNEPLYVYINPSDSFDFVDDDTDEVYGIPFEQNDSENQKKKVSTKNKPELDLSMVEERFLSIVEDWIEYKKERKQSYKPKGFKTFYKHLLELSDNNPILARKIVDKSMSCNYAGIFPLKDSEKIVSDTGKENIPILERFIEWITTNYPTIREMEMPNEVQMDEILRITGNNIVWYFDQLQDYYHEGSLYELFMERFGGNR